MFTATASITRAQLDEILDTAELVEDDGGDNGADTVDVRADYSGRGMYGAECLGLTVSGQSAAMRFAAGMSAVLGEDEAREILRNTETDSMGRYMIVYFPGLTLSS